MTKTESRKKGETHRDESRTPDLDKVTRRRLQKIVDEWDASGRTRTSAYWRLVSTLEGKERKQ